MLMEVLVRGVASTGQRGELGAVEVTSVEHDSRHVGPGALFCCVPGAHADGHDHAAAAVDAGAVALLSERPMDLEVPQVWVAPGTVRTAMAQVSSEFYGHPWRDLTMIGVTGTNGKTTVTHLVAAILGAAGAPTGVVGTLGGARTTPEAPELERQLRRLRDDGVRAVAVEVSSHALTQHRVDGIVFDVAVFTNLSRDHLDHHGSMEEYFAAKSRLFSSTRARHAVVATDGSWGRRLAESIHGLPVTEVRRSDASDVLLEAGHTAFTWRGHRLTTRLTGEFNVENALLAANVATVLGVREEQVAAGLAEAGPVPGRMEVIDVAGPFTVVVDYAHTPDGLAAALGAARGLSRSGRVVCLFGCGGDRDPGKRPDMGAVAERLADLVVLTSDNPRSEEPAAIIEDVRRGMPGRTETIVEPDRHAAILEAVHAARPGDVVLLAGKGHERTQTRGTEELPFDDRVEARRALEGRGARGRA